MDRLAATVQKRDIERLRPTIINLQLLLLLGSGESHRGASAFLEPRVVQFRANLIWEIGHNMLVVHALDEYKKVENQRGDLPRSIQPPKGRISTVSVPGIAPDHAGPGLRVEFNRVIAAFVKTARPLLVLVSDLRSL
jgi:hypothetical protein